MDDAFGVGGVESAGDLNAEIEDVSMSSGFSAIRCLRVWPSRNSMAMKAFDFPLVNFVDGADVGVVESGGGTSLAAETFERLRIVSYVVGQEFQGDKAAEAGVFRFIYDAHSAAAELLDDAVMRNVWPIMGNAADIFRSAVAPKSDCGVHESSV